MTYGKNIWFLLLALIHAHSLHANAANTIFFLLAEPEGHKRFNTSCVIPISRPQDIAQARKMIAEGSTSSLIPVFRVAAGKDGLNRDYLAPGIPEWSWHATEFFDFEQNIIADIGANPQSVQERIDSFTAHNGGLVGLIRYVVVEELGPALSLTTQVNENGVTISWPEISTNRAYAPIGTNFVYTLETSDALSSTNWMPVAGGPWPAKTNQWTLSKASASNRFFRVRANVAP